MNLNLYLSRLVNMLAARCSMLDAKRGALCQMRCVKVVHDSAYLLCVESLEVALLAQRHHALCDRTSHYMCYCTDVA